MANTKDIPTYQEARKAAGIPEQTKVSELVDREIVVLDKEPATARLPETNEEREGLLVRVHVLDKGEDMLVFVGQMVLLTELGRLSLPFKTTIKRNGRTYHFS